MKLKEAMPEDPNKTPFAGSQQTFQIVVEPSGGAFRATIQTINGKPYGSNPIHPKEFMASGKTVADALIELGKKLKI